MIFWSYDNFIGFEIPCLSCTIICDVNKNVPCREKLALCMFSFYWFIDTSSWSCLWPNVSPSLALNVKNKVIIWIFWIHPQPRISKVFTSITNSCTKSIVFELLYVRSKLLMIFRNFFLYLRKLVGILNSELVACAWRGNKSLNLKVVMWSWSSKSSFVNITVKSWTSFECGSNIAEAERSSLGTAERNCTCFCKIW